MKSCGFSKILKMKICVFSISVFNTEPLTRDHVKSF